ncbi:MULTISPECIES: RraA family protein [unclassified Phenylobacterium]|uniref:RraA family protein n=1 Tax=unclassified Phenylobacterium TaxID=2640670 RepID=UPI00083ABD88|nr:MULTISPECIES: RraA family protein [unclassified Phenylobacterium]
MNPARSEQVRSGAGVGDDLVAAAAGLSAASLHEAARRAGALPAALKPVDPAMRLCGRALPVRCPAGDNLWIHRALADADPGEVLVVETGAGADFGYWGEIMATAAIARGLAGLVITGGVRDSLRLIELGLPTFSAAISIRGTLKNPAGAGAVGEPVRIGEVVVRRGDLVFGDADGVVVLDPETAAAAVPAAARRDADEAAILDQVRAGALTLDVYKL